MATPYSTGAAALYVGLGSGGSPLFLGHFESNPDIQISPEWEALMSDLSGSKKPFDKAYMGEDAVVSGDLTRWNETVYAQCAARPNSSITVPRGLNTSTDRGSLMMTEGLAYPVWVHYPNGGVKVQYVGMVPGYHFLAGWLEGPDQLKPGLKPYKVRVNFYFGAVYSPASGTFTLYDHNMAGIPAVPPN